MTESLLLFYYEMNGAFIKGCLGISGFCVAYRNVAWFLCALTLMRLESP